MDWTADIAVEIARLHRLCQRDHFDALALAPVAAGGVPEPATWAVMLFGIGMAGGAPPPPGAGRPGGLRSPEPPAHLIAKVFIPHARSAAE